MQKWFWIILVILVAAGGYWYYTQPAAPAGLANPASVNCEETLGGTLEIVTTSVGQTGYCHLPDGRVCEEWDLYRSSTCTPPPTLSQDLYPLYSGATWNAPEPESVTIGSTTLTGASVSSVPVTDTMDPGSIFTPFEEYYASKLAALGYAVDNYLAAGGHVGGQTGYRKGGTTILTRFHIDYHTVSSTSPSTCPCDVTLSLFSSAPPVAASYKDATYTIDGKKITLVNGVAEEPAAPGSASTLTTKYFGNEASGDLNGDGTPDVAFLLTQDGGGSGTFYYVVAALATTTGYAGTNAILLGDRVAPQTTEIKDGEIIVNYAERKPGEPMTARPSVGVSTYLRVSGGVLSEVPHSDQRSVY